MLLGPTDMVGRCTCKASRGLDWAESNCTGLGAVDWESWEKTGGDETIGPVPRAEKSGMEDRLAG